MMQLNVRSKGEQCALFADGRLLFQAPWRDFDAVVEGMRRITRRVSTHEHGSGIEMRADGDSVVLSVGRWSSACKMSEFSALASAMHQMARTAESQNNAVLNQQVADGALLARVGLPFGLSDNPRVKDAIANTVAHDRTLRRAIPFATVAKIPGTPRVRHVSNVEALQILSAQHAHQTKDLYGQAS
jgi:hypothetical protein